MFADLHIHSFYSDGTNSPKELVKLAKENNVSVIAMADHDTIEGVEELLLEAGRN
ncbi:PHP domain-containing protein, partial [Herbivorax sp. ANBcel31]|uniref:PHP domain-containing protein n=1 Tax=Herbivorax sp. ANBcel31 TaxID=3069754 RepID=UPI0027B37AA6